MLNPTHSLTHSLRSSSCAAIDTSLNDSLTDHKLSPRSNTPVFPAQRRFFMYFV